MLYIFDWDGTISDSAAKIVKCMQEAASGLNLEPRSAEQVKNIIGLGLPEAILTLYPELQAEVLDAYRASYSQYFSAADTTPSSFFPQVMDTLDRLKADSHHLSVATGKSRRGLNRVLGNLGLSDYFHYSRCADETASKPDPLMLQQLMDEADVKIEDCVMIGDTEWDMKMAENIGMSRIAVSYGAHSRERLLSFEPDLCIDRFEEILDWRKGTS